jgi:hypothetical protein
MDDDNSSVKNWVVESLAMNVITCHLLTVHPVEATFIGACWLKIPWDKTIICFLYTLW